LIQLERLNFFKWLNGLGNKEYLLSVIAYGTAPTMLTNKPATLLNFQDGLRDLYTHWHQYKNDASHTLGLEFFELKEELKEGRRNTCVLFYKEGTLEAYLMKPQIRMFLNSMGYERCETVHDFLSTLRYRFQANCPHEIGLFLGFPVQDVIGFIKNKGQNCIMCRYWKVYHNPEEAKQIFSAYDEARSAVINSIKEFIPQ
jgi:hypothetical protein